jgi:hypothetical protein
MTRAAEVALGGTAPSVAALLATIQATLQAMTAVHATQAGQGQWIAGMNGYVGTLGQSVAGLLDVTGQTFDLVLAVDG